MIRRIVVSLAALAVLLPAVSGAQVPKYVNFQSVLRDDGGNLVEDGFVDLQIKILDQDKDVVYEETQPGVQVVRSAINVMIGEGIEPGSSPAAPTGGIPLNALDPANGSHSLQIQFGSNLPSDPMELGSVPYAMYAERALGLAPNILSGDVPDVFVTEDELAAAIQAHENDTTAHPASSITTIDEFGNSDSTNVQDVLDDLDAAIDAEESARATADSGLQSQINGKVNRSGDTMTGLLNFDAGSGETVRIEHDTGNISTPGTVDGVDVSSLNSTVTVNHENRITALEAPDLLKINGWATITDPTDAAGAKSFTGTPLISSVTRIKADPTYGDHYRVNFSTTLSRSDYCAIATASDDPGLNKKMYANVPERATTYVRVRIKEESGGADYGDFSILIVGGTP